MDVVRSGDRSVTAAAGLHPRPLCTTTTTTSTLRLRLTDEFPGCAGAVHFCCIVDVWRQMVLGTCEEGEEGLWGFTVMGEKGASGRLLMGGH